jgi:hypothetical protein
MRQLFRFFLLASISPLYFAKIRIMKRFITRAVLLSCLSLVSFILLSGIDGKWKGTFTPPDGHKVPVGYDFKTDNDKLTGVAHGLDADYDISEGKVKGDSIFFSVVVEGGDKIVTKGKYFAASDSISLILTFAGESMPGSIKRVAEK